MTMATIIKLTWKDGVTTSSTTWAGLIEKIGSLPWNKGVPLQKVYDELAYRAWVWDRIEVDPLQDPETVLRSLAKAGFFTIETESA